MSYQPKLPYRGKPPFSDLLEIYRSEVLRAKLKAMAEIIKNNHGEKMSDDIIYCCEAFRKAHENGTDNEAYGQLIYDDDDLGCNLPPIKFCPWCGKPRTEGECTTK